MGMGWRRAGTGTPTAAGGGRQCAWHRAHHSAARVHTARALCLSRALSVRRVHVGDAALGN